MGLGGGAPDSSPSMRAPIAHHWFSLSPKLNQDVDVVRDRFGDIAEGPPTKTSELHDGWPKLQGRPVGRPRCARRRKRRP